MKEKVMKEIKSWTITIIVSVILVVILNLFVLKSARVEGNSMYSTLHNQDFGITWVFPIKFKNIKRFDIVVVDKKEQGNWIKRVVALPNETIEYKSGKLYINDQLVEETFLKEAFIGNFEKLTLKEDEYFVVGDNRNHSTDSRMIGPVHLNEITSSGFFVIYPFDRIGAK